MRYITLLSVTSRLISDYDVIRMIEFGFDNVASEYSSALARIPPLRPTLIDTFSIREDYEYGVRASSAITGVAGYSVKDYIYIYNEVA